MHLFVNYILRNDHPINRWETSFQKNNPLSLQFTEGQILPSDADLVFHLLADWAEISYSQLKGKNTNT